MSDAPVIRQAAKTAATPRKAAVPKPKPIVPVAKKPFHMSYDDTTIAEHVQYLIARGAR